MNSPLSPARPPELTTVRWAALMLGAYALVVLVNATVLQAMNDWEGIAEYPRALVRAVGLGLIIWGLLRRARWAWWFAVVLVSLWMVTGVAGLGVLLSLRRADSDALLPPAFYVTAALTIVLLAAAAALLLMRSSRVAFGLVKGGQQSAHPVAPTGDS